MNLPHTASALPTVKITMAEKGKMELGMDLVWYVTSTLNVP